ncbi:MAG: bacillithiol biosynthesis cysteine-adding enzyme BshC [Acidobacteria bacterium]|nr:bacillithiol biosynthesis cysteine-adding enzyme BshC [Acidobacteriota bacterium]
MHLARQIEGNAIYWLETNDADFNEINHIDYLDDQGELKTLTWNIDSHGYACGYIDVDENLEKLLETFFASIRQTEFTPHLKSMVLDCYRPGRSLSEASQDLAGELFGHLKIHIFTPFDWEFKKFSQHILRKEAVRTLDGEQCNCFFILGKQRKALFRNGRCFYTREKMPVNLLTSELVPNVKTRSVCQDAFFKTHTYVAGPSEVKYLAELDPIYVYHGVKKAAVQPRMSITLLEPKVKRLLTKTGLSLEDVLQSTREELLKIEMSKETGFAFNEIKPLRKNVQEEVKKIIGQMRSRTKGKITQALKHISFLSDNLKPFGNRQERVFNIIYYMNLFGGKKFIDWLYHQYDPSRTFLEIENDRVP